MSKKDEPPKQTAKPPTIKPSAPKDDFDDLLQELSEKVEKRKDPPAPVATIKTSTSNQPAPINIATSVRNLVS